MRPAGIRCVLVLGVLALLGSACGITIAAQPPPAPPMASSQIAIAAQTITNRGTVVHVMLTAVDAKAPVGSYDDEAGRFCKSPPDPSIVGTGMILPGGTLKIPVRILAQQALALAFFFTEPGANWRVVVAPPLPSRISILLGSDGVDRMEPDGHGP